MIIETLKKIFYKKSVQTKPIKILVIEDTPVDQRIAVEAIKKGGYEAFTADDGNTGFEKAKEIKPDLIILDYNLPDISGPQVCMLLKKNTDTNRIPVIFLTSMDAPASVIECYEKGGDNYLYKPISPKVLLKYINNSLKDNKDENNNA